MAKTAQDIIEQRRKRIAEYDMMRGKLLSIIEAADTMDADRIAAINTIYQIDVEGVPLP